MSTECIAIVGAIATVLAGFGGAALGACFAYKTGMKLVQKTHKNAIDLMQRQRFDDAASKFRTCFTEQIRVLQKDGGTNPHEFLSKAYIRHWNAVIEFSTILNAKNKNRLNEQWEKYQQAYESSLFHSTGKPAGQRKECYALALEHILELIDVSKYK